MATDSEKANAAIQAESKPREPQRENQAEKLVGLLKESTTELFSDEYGKPFAAFRDARELLNVWPIRSGAFRQWASKLAYDTWGKVPYTEALGSALNTLEGMASFGGGRHPLAVRVAHFEDAIWYDLGDWRAVKITPQGWTVTASPILFRRFPLQIPQAEPIQGGDIKTLLKFVPLKGCDNEILFLTYIVAALVPGIPQPPIIFHGQQGSAKTFTFRLIKALLDPAQPYCSSPPSNIADLVQYASKHYAVFLDNMSHLPDWLSDALCRLCTGDGFSKRQLYTDDDDIVYNLRRVTGINGRNLVVTQADLLQRALLFHFEAIPDSDRKREVELLEAFDTAKASILGGIFSLLTHAMVIGKTLSISNYPRMADYYHWALAVARAMGYTVKDFERAFRLNVEAQNSEAVEASLVAQAVLRLMAKETRWQGSPSELLEKLNNVTPEKEQRSREWPKGSNWIWKRLEVVVPNLLAMGVRVNGGDDNRTAKDGRAITLERASVGEEKMPSLLTSNPNTKAEPESVGISENAVTGDGNADTSVGKRENAVTYESPENQIGNDGNDGNDGIFPTLTEKDGQPAPTPETEEVTV